MILKWITVNILTIILIIFYSFLQGYDSNYILMGKILGQAAFILFLININMYFVFLLIRKSKIRIVKIKLAKISKEMMKYHIPIAITAVIIIVVHAGIMLLAQLNHFWTSKTITGLLSIGILVILLYSGLLRRRKATGKRRKFHYSMAFVFFGFIIIHIFI